MDKRSREELLMIIDDLKKKNIKLRNKLLKQKTETELQKLEKQHKKILDSFVDGIYIISLDYTILYMNKAMTKMIGKDKIGKKCYRAIYNQEKPCPWCQYDKLNKDNRFITYDIKIPGTDEYRLTRNVLLDDGSVLTIYCDITERKKAEEALKISEEKAKFLNDVTFEGIVTHKNGIIVDTNESFLRMTGYTRKEAIGANILDYIPRAKDRVMIMKRIDKKTVRPYEILAARKDGSTFIAEVEAHSITKDNGETIRIVSVHDVTERIKAEKELKESKETAERYLNIAAEIIISLDTKGNILLLNDRGHALLGYKKGELIGKNFFDICVPKKRVNEIKDVFGKLINGKFDTVEHYENLIITKKGELKEISWYNALLFDESNKIIGILSSGEDITYKKQAEEELKKNLREKEILIREVHHRVKNNMQVISAILSLQADEIGDERLSGVLNQCISRVQSMSKVHEMMYRTSDLEHLDMSEYIHEMIESLRNLYPLKKKGIIFKENSKNVFLNLNQAIPVGIIVNELISNAMKHAFPDDQKGIIEIRLHKINGEIRMRVSNNGIPLPDDFNIEVSTSLGLEIVNLLTEQLAGKMKVQSTEEETFFKLTFPIEK